MACFLEERPKEYNTFDFALFVEDGEGLPLGYMTCIEYNKETVYMQHGGGFPSIAQTTRVYAVYHLMMNYLKEHYKKLTTLIWNENLKMLKLAYTAGLRPTGIEFINGQVYLQLTLGL